MTENTDKRFEKRSDISPRGGTDSKDANEIMLNTIRHQIKLKTKRKYLDVPGEVA